MATKSSKKDKNPLGQNPSSTTVLNALGVPKTPYAAKPSHIGRSAAAEALDEIAIPFVIEILTQIREDFHKSKREIKPMMVPNVVALGNCLEKWSGRAVMKLAATDANGEDLKTTVDQDALDAIIDARLAQRKNPDEDAG